MDTKKEHIVEYTMGLIRDEITSLGCTEMNLSLNSYGFVKVWIEDDGSVWWDKNNAYFMSEITELWALYDTIIMTKEELNK